MLRTIIIVAILFSVNSSIVQANDDCAKYASEIKMYQDDCNKAANQLIFSAKRLASCASAKNHHKSCVGDYEWVKKAYDSYENANHGYEKYREKLHNKCK